MIDTIILLITATAFLIFSLVQIKDSDFDEMREDIERENYAIDKDYFN